MRISSSLSIIMFLTLMAALGQQRPQISADRASIKVGESTKLTWRSDANSAFLLGVGKVSSIDVVGVSPNTTTEYILVTEKEGEVNSASVKVTVAGTKGDLAFPDPDEFPQGLSGERKSTSYPDFLNVAFKTLQDSLQFQVRGDFLPGRRFHILFTDRRPKQDLLRPNDTGIRQRRIAYAVRAEEPDFKGRPIIIRFEVKAIVDYQRAGESKWRPETSQEIIYSATEALKRQLETGA